MPTFRPAAARLVTLTLGLGLALLLAGCASAPDSYTELPIEPAPQYNKADLPRLKGVLLKLAGKMYSANNVTVAYVANRENTALYELVQREGKWSLWSLIQWSVYDRAYCVHYVQSSPGCLVELDDSSYLEESVPKRRNAWLKRLAVAGTKRTHKLINSETGEIMSPFEGILRPLNVPASDLKAVLAEGSQAEAAFQEKVSFATRDAKRYARWRAMRDEDRQSAAEFNAFMTGLHGQLQEANREADAQLARSTSNLNDTLARIREQERQQERQQARGQAPASPQPGSPRTRSGQAGGAAVPAARGTVQTAEGKSVGGGARPAVAAGTRARATDAPARRETQGETVQRQPYPEAVTVCSKPSGPHLAFECMTPLQRIRGNKDDISGMRSPQEYIASSEACPAPRQLVSSTHLVWGCGFAATGGVNALDRGQGVAIQGRRTYYCTEKQLSCRRTQP